MEINRVAGALRVPSTPGDGRDGEGAGAVGSDPILVSQMVMLERANKVLESSVASLRTDTTTKLAPLLERIALLEEERRIVEEEMNTKLGCREVTINSLENSLQQLQKGKKFRFSKKKGLKLKAAASAAVPNRAASS